jgi:hypothetical protein
MVGVGQPPQAVPLPLGLPQLRPDLRRVQSPGLRALRASPKQLGRRPEQPPEQHQELGKKSQQPVQEHQPQGWPFAQKAQGLGPPLGHSQGLLGSMLPMALLGPRLHPASLQEQY